jgi:hypothetical protein
LGLTEKIPLTKLLGVIAHNIANSFLARI